MIIAGEIFHRDFHTYAAQLILLNYLLVIMKLDDVVVIRRRTVVYRALTITTIALFIVWIFWLMMMAYAIVTRADPRWIEATGYNLVNGLIGLLMLVSVCYVWDRARRMLHFRKNRLHLDDRDISSMLSPQECDFIHAFLYAKNNSISCEELHRVLNPGGSVVRPDCDSCISKNWKATSCAIYRNYRNRINDIKKYLELIQSGTIITVSENPRNIKVAGWRLRLFDDVHFLPRRM